MTKHGPGWPGVPFDDSRLLYDEHMHVGLITPCALEWWLHVMEWVEDNWGDSRVRSSLLRASAALLWAIESGECLPDGSQFASASLNVLSAATGMSKRTCHDAMSRLALEGRFSHLRAEGLTPVVEVVARPVARRSWGTCYALVRFWGDCGLVPKGLPMPVGVEVHGSSTPSNGNVVGVETLGTSTPTGDRPVGVEDGDSGVEVPAASTPSDTSDSRELSSSGGNAGELDRQYRRVLASFPSSPGRAYERRTRAAFEALVEDGYEPQAIAEGAAAYRRDGVRRAEREGLPLKRAMLVFPLKWLEEPALVARWCKRTETEDPGFFVQKSIEADGKHWLGGCRGIPIDYLGIPDEATEGQAMDAVRAKWERSRRNRGERR